MRAVTTVIESTPLTLHELARAVGADDQWVVRLVEVEILQVDVTIPKGARNGMKLRLKERGLGGKTPGHLYLLLEIALPPADSDATRAAYEALAKASASFNPRQNLGG